MSVPFAIPHSSSGELRDRRSIRQVLESWTRPGAPVQVPDDILR